MLGRLKKLKKFKSQEIDWGQLLQINQSKSFKSLELFLLFTNIVVCG